MRALSRSSLKSPEHTLIAFVLDRALRDYRLGYEDALEWVACDDDDEFSFVYICQHLDISVEALRAELIKGGYAIAIC